MINQEDNCRVHIVYLVLFYYNWGWKRSRFAKKNVEQHICFPEQLIQEHVKRLYCNSNLDNQCHVRLAVESFTHEIPCHIPNLNDFRECHQFHDLHNNHLFLAHFLKINISHRRLSKFWKWRQDQDLARRYRRFGISQRRRSKSSLI